VRIEEKLKYGELGAELVEDGGRTRCGVKSLWGAIAGADMICAVWLGFGDASCCVERVGPGTLGGKRTTKVTK
jgi:hypothetical protein